MALAQADIRRMLAYSSVGHMGYILVGFALGNSAALTGALLHVLNHSVMKGCLFFAMGSVLWDTRSVNVYGFAGVSRRLPVTTAMFTLAAISMIGLPPTAGFFSKWYLLQGAIEADAWIFAAVLLVSSLLSAVYFFRVIERAYFVAPLDETTAAPRRRFEVPPGMLGPVVVLGVMVLLLGLFNHAVVTRFVVPALPAVN